MTTRMRPHVAVLSTLVSLTLFAIASPARSQGGPPRPETDPTGTARITGRVLAKDNGAPVRRAHVRLSGVPAATGNAAPTRPSLQKDVETDDHGAFDFARLPAGSYYISVGRANGFVELPRAKQAIVGEGQALDLSLRLERTGAIVGRVVDRNGDGILGVEVLALRRNDVRGRVTLTAANAPPGSTNDLGQFRLFNLSPGEYLVVAAPVGTAMNSFDDVNMGRRSGFLTTYFPGTRDRGKARLVIVRAGKDVTHVNFSLASGPLARVAVDALDSHERPLGREASATLNLFSDVYLSSAMRQAHRQDDGQFVFSEVPFGRYYLIVNTSQRQEEAAYLEVNVDGDVTLKAQTNSGAKVSGRFVVQGAPPETTARPMANVVITATPPLGTTGPSYAHDALVHPQATDRFELTGLRGPMILHAQMGGALLASISRTGGEDIAGKPLEFTGTEIMDDLLVVFTYEKADVEITLTGLREPDDPEKVLVILFSEDSARWHAGLLQYTVIEATAEMPRLATVTSGSRPGRIFTFPLGPVVPGRYLIAAVPNPGVMFPTDRAVLERLRPLAVPVTLAAGETSKVQVRVSR